MWLLFTLQSYLIANHLPKEDLLDVCLYCQHYCLLPLAAEQRVGQLVVWREVFPQQRASGGGAAMAGFRHSQGRHFLLIVGIVRRRLHPRCPSEHLFLLLCKVLLNQSFLSAHRLRGI